MELRVRIPWERANDLMLCEYIAQLFVFHWICGEKFVQHCFVREELCRCNGGEGGPCMLSDHNGTCMQQMQLKTRQNLGHTDPQLCILQSDQHTLYWHVSTIITSQVLTLVLADLVTNM